MRSRRKSLTREASAGVHEAFDSGDEGWAVLEIESPPLNLKQRPIAGHVGEGVH